MRALVHDKKALVHDKKVLGLHDGSNDDAHFVVAFYILVYVTLLLADRMMSHEKPQPQP